MFSLRSRFRAFWAVSNRRRPDSVIRSWREGKRWIETGNPAIGPTLPGFRRGRLFDGNMTTSDIIAILSELHFTKDARFSRYRD
jgi:hypothetical protein